jgi:RND family efflux transporter MFP subunit
MTTDDMDMNISDRRRRLLMLLVAVVVLVAVVAGGVMYIRGRTGGRDVKADPQSKDMEQSMPGMPGMSADRKASDPPGNVTPPVTTNPTSGSQGSASSDGGGAPQTFFVAPERRQTIGVKISDVEERIVSKVIRSTARVAIDERKTARIHTKIAGWIEQVFVNFVGEPVKRGQPLFTIYSPELVASQEEYLLALRAQRELGDSSFERARQGGNLLADAARRRLQLWDLTPAQIEQVERTGTVSRTATIYSPMDGVVLLRGAYQNGQRVTPENEIYTIVDLSSVWLLGQVFEGELPFVRVGQTAHVEFPYGAGEAELTGRVTFIAPFIDPQTRTGQIRIELPNRSGTLRPDAFYNVRLDINLGKRIVVPAEAVMNTGERQYVFVDVGDGYFEPREVRTGAEVENGRVVERGLKPGERVVTAANFLIDAESRLRGAFAAMGKPSQAPAEKGPSGPALKVEVTTEPSPAKVGKNRIRVRVLDPAGTPVQDAEVDVKLFMPQMGAMGQMEAKASLFPAAAGEYTGEIDIPMAWTWETTVTVRKGGKVISMTRTNVTAR